MSHTSAKRNPAVLQDLEENEGLKQDEAEEEYDDDTEKSSVGFELSLLPFRRRRGD